MWAALRTIWNVAFLFGFIALALGLSPPRLSLAQPYVTLHAGPGNDGTTGYVLPGFHHDDLSFFPQASWQLLNDSGMATWYSDYIPSDANYNAIRFHPPTGPPTQLPDPATGGSISPTSIPYAINASGTIVGQARNSFNHDLPVRWNATGVPTILPTLTTFVETPPRPGRANDINDSGIAVGWSGRWHPTININLGDRAVRWDAAGNISELGQISFDHVPCGDNTCSIANSEAYAVNIAGVAVGRAYVYDGSGGYDGDRAVRWNASGVGTELGHLGTEASPTSADTLAAAWAINGAGDAVGYALKYDSGVFKGTRAVRWNHDSTAAIELGLLGTDVTGSTSSKVYTINESGTSVGWLIKYGDDGSGGLRGVRWDDAGQVTELELLQAVGNSTAIDINDAGITVGWASTPGGRDAALWEANGSVLNLNTLIDPGSGWYLTDALAISNTGWIAGLGTYDPDGPNNGQFPYTRAFMLQLPSNVPLVGDYNGNGIVDAPDYVVWRDSYNSGAILPNDQSPGWVSEDDYRLWRDHFGETLGESAIASQTIPEPATFAIALPAALVLSLLCRRPKVDYTPIGVA